MSSFRGGQSLKEHLNLTYVCTFSEVANIKSFFQVRTDQAGGIWGNDKVM